MHQKKKIWRAAGIALFFLIGGLWYVFWYLPGTAEEEENISWTPTPLLSAEVIPTTIPTTALLQEEDEPRLIYVYLCGAVNNPGVYELTEGARLYMAVEMAGGFWENADRAYHNLAREVSDGERIYILTLEETSALTLSERVTGEEEESSGTEGKNSGQTGTEIVNINTAGLSELMTLPGIGESKAESILEYRTRVGRFTEIEEIKNISGIGEAMFEKIKDKITVK